MVSRRLTISFKETAKDFFPLPVFKLYSFLADVLQPGLPAKAGQVVCRVKRQSHKCLNMCRMLFRVTYNRIFFYMKISGYRPFVAGLKNLAAFKKPTHW